MPPKPHRETFHMSIHKVSSSKKLYHREILTVLVIYVAERQPRSKAQGALRAARGLSLCFLEHPPSGRVPPL